MKKKVIATLIATMSFVNFTGCASEGNNEKVSNKTNQEIALERISEFMANNNETADITRVKDESLINSSKVISWITTTTAGEESEDYCLWIVDQTSVEEDITVFFLFGQEKYVIAANQLENETKLVTDEKWVDKDFMNYADDQNYSHGGFAWEETDYSYAFLNREAGYNCSSIWVLDNTQNNISLVWYDSQLEGWENYSKYTG